MRFATADELATVLASLLELRGLSLEDADAAIVSSVVPAARARVRAADRALPRRQRRAGGAGAQDGHADPHRHARRSSGPTGWPTPWRPTTASAARASRSTSARPSTTTSCPAAGEYLGGVISPGIEISLEALAARAARLPRVDIEAPRHAIGKGTKEAIQSGVVYGYAGQVDGILGRLREELGEEATAIATGGFAAAIVPFCDQVDEVDDLLTLTGLKLIWERNRSSS